MEFTGEIARLQQRLTECQELTLRRYAVVEQLAPRRGERVLEIGCGAGLLLREIGLVTGPHGLAAGVDISPDQIARAGEECSGIPAVRPAVGDATALAYPESVFDAAVAVQVIEYIPDAVASLAELHRVLKPGGRLVCLSTNWTSTFWHGADTAVTSAVATAWESHADHPNLPARLAPMLQRAGFVAIRQLPVPIVNPEFDNGSYAYWLAQLMAGYAIEHGVAETVAADWLAALQAAEDKGEFFFSSVPILTTAVRT